MTLDIKGLCVRRKSDWERFELDENGFFWAKDDLGCTFKGAATCSGGIVNLDAKKLVDTFELLDEG